MNDLGGSPSAASDHWTRSGGTSPELSWSDGLRIWTQQRPTGLPADMSDELARRLLRLSNQLLNTVLPMSLLSGLFLMVLYPPITAGRIGWYTLRIALDVGTWIATRHVARQPATPDLYYRYLLAYAPLAALFGLSWGTVPALTPYPVIATSFTEYSLAIAITIVALFIGYIWLTAAWLNAHLFGLCLMGAVVTIEGNSSNSRIEAILLGSTCLVVVGVTSWLICLFTCRAILSHIAVEAQNETITLLLRDFESGAQDWFWECDADLNLTYVPERMREAAAGTPVVDGFPLASLLTQDDPGLATINDLTRRSQPFVDVQVRLASSSPTWWKLSARPFVDEDGHTIGYRGVGSDITSIKQLDLMTRSRLRSDAFTDIATRVTHDFNNILGSVRAAADIIGLRVGADSDLQPAIGTIDRSCERARKITSQLMSYLAKDVSLEPTQILVRREVNRIVEEFLGQVGAGITVTIDGDETTAVLADPVRFGSCIENLLNNSAQAMNGEGAIQVKIRPLATGTPVLMVSIIVADEGPGIPPEERQAIFEPFYTTRQAAGGSGLGLSMAVGFANQSGGSLRLVNTQDGAAFELVLPSAAPFTEDDLLIDLESDDADDGRTMVILLEDDEEMASTLDLYLTDAGYRTKLAYTVTEAMVLLNANVNRVGLIISDILLPDGRGYDFVGAARRRHPGIPALYITGFTDELPSSLGESAVAPIVHKPFRLADLEAAIDSVLGESKTA